ncbi:MAG: c-type cytochrome [Phycisphaera sp.]|nr:c-type cytochrome [Phycisphaera sp.]
MSDKKYKDILTGHNYDGIQEYDNPTPGWWWLVFHCCIAFAVCYFVFFHISIYGWTRDEAYSAEVKRNFDKQFAALGQLEVNGETIARFLNEPQWLDVGRTVFQTNCISCHGKQGEGLVGPNMTDDRYKNIKQIGDFGTVISNGAAKGAMPAWKTRLSPNEIVLVASYVASLRGQNLSGPRPPEGDVPPPWPVPDKPADAETPAKPDAPK